MNITPDTLWKGIIEDLALDFLQFFFPSEVETLDFNRPFEFLDKELAQLFDESVDRSKFVDKLIKVYTNTGQEEWILVHVEIQGYREQTFEKRMYTYFYRIFDRYQKPVTALAIFTDEDVNYLPNKFLLNVFGTRMHYSYNTYKIITQDESKLVEDPNPFSKVILACLLWLKNKKSSDDTILSLKISLIRQLLKNSYPESKIRSIFEFINPIIRFKYQGTESLFEEKIQEIIPKIKNMGLQEAILYEVKQQGIAEGIAKGKQQGIAEGKQQGIAEGKQQGIAEGKQQGIVEGKKQGIAEAEKKKILAIQNMLKKGFAEIEIAEIFGMTTQEIVAIRIKMDF